MRAIPVASAALLGLAALPLAAPTATADDHKVTSFGFSISPSTVAPGGQVTLGVTNCGAPTASASSGVFDTVTIPNNGSVRVTVDRDARRGALYSVTFTCRGEADTIDLAISIAGGTTFTPRPTPPPPTTTAQGVRGGLGGSFGGMNATEIAAGGALFVLAVAGTVYVVRRRTGNRQH
ncbi:hypothetical protein NLX86_08745 [Streptomyces sp. A3M-1-3]|uniref:hypothetical protein n=1 Tax=Streptomyces sp. A3M-1-3 TaxID=2962044 RepID=UPI0020B6E2B8|nr:hypothetical protein [Streptomyces sp. A3M-1-3]MCP3818198.1 hypothetical protein [Streptomyces sp. A3M-1-3]